MTDHDTDGEPQNFDDDDPAQAPESDPDPLLPLTVENRLGAVLEHAGSMVGRANERGLMFYPGQNRAFLARRIHHPSVSAQNSRGATVNVQAAAAVILASDRGVDTDYLPMARNAGLEQPTPSVHIQLADGLPVRGQPLPRVPANRELQRFISFSGFGGEQEHEDREWSDTHIRNYLHGKRTAGGEAALARWDCQACYDRAKFLRVPPAGLEGEFSAARHSVSSTRVESARDADEFRKGMKLMARVQGLGHRHHLTEVNIGHVTMPGGGRVGDVMPHWARVVQMIAALRRYNLPGRGGARRPPLSYVAMASHGWTDGTQLGLTMSPSDNEMAYLYTLLFLRELAQRCLPDLSVVIYGCSAGGETESFGSRSIGRWIADKLLEFRVVRPRVDAHTVVGHTFKAPWLRRFEPHIDAGGSGGVWIVPPPNVSHAQQVRGEDGELLKLRRERLAAYRQRAKRARNYARMIARSNRTIPHAVREDFKDAQNSRWAGAESLRTASIRHGSDDIGRAAIQAYRDIIFEQERFLVQHNLAPSDSMLEVLRLNQVDFGDAPRGRHAQNQTGQANSQRWARWNRALQLGLDGLNFCVPMISSAELADYIDRLPEAAAAAAPRPRGRQRDAEPNLEQSILGSGEPHFWFYSFEFGTTNAAGKRIPATAPEGEYFGTIPGNWNDRGAAARARRRRPR